MQLLINGVVKMHVEKYAEIDQNFTIKILREFYKDDLKSNVNLLEEGAELYKKLKIRFFKRKFNLRKWTTNDENVCVFIKERRSRK